MQIVDTRRSSPIFQAPGYEATVNREILVVEKFSQSHKATKFNLMKYILQQSFSTTYNLNITGIPDLPTFIVLSITASVQVSQSHGHTR